MRQFLARLISLVDRRRLDQEMEEEISAHLEFAQADLRAQGLGERDAKFAARRHFGSVAQTKDAERDSRGFRLFEDLMRDLRYAARGLRRNPASTAVIVITLALGIGATTTIFSAVDAVLLQRVPIADPDRVVSVYTLFAARTTVNPNAGDQVGPWSYPNYVDVRDSGALQGLAAFASISMTLAENGIAEPIDGQIVSGNYFSVLGVHAILGRELSARDDQIDAPARVAVLSYRAWQQRHGGSRDVVGRSITLNGNPYTVIGVAPRGFFGSVLGDAPEVWVPMALQPEARPPSAGPLRQRLGGLRMLGARDITWLELVGRLKEGSSVTGTAAELAVIAHQLAAAYPEANRDRSATAMRLGEAPGIRTRARPVLRLLSAAVAIVLLIACANVAGLLLARAVSRRREVAVRVAIGAGRGRLVRQWLTESILLGVFGGAGGLLVVYWGAPLLYGLGVLRDVELAIDARVFVFALAAGVATGVVFGLAPTFQLVQRNILPALRDEGGSVATGARAARIRSAFIVVQVGLSLILLVGAGLFIRTFQQALAVDLGYRVDRMLLAEVSPSDKYTPESGQAFYRELLDRLNALPGVTAAGAARVTVLSGASRQVPVSVDGTPVRPDRSNVIPVRVNVVTDRYLDAMGIPVLRGRGIQAADVRTAPRIAVVSQSLANRLWPDGDPIGKMLISDSPAQVVGVVPDTVYRNATDPEPRPFYYLPLAQNYEAGVTIHVRTAGDPMALLPAVRQVLQDLDPRLVLTRPRRLVDEFDRSTTPQWTMAMLTGALSGIALLLAAVGLYGVMSYATRQRTTEVGLRLALGASPRSILTLIVMRGARLVAMGTIVGLAGAVASVRFVRGQLFGVEASDPLTWVAVSAVLLVVALIACVIPATRAMRVEPSTALRTL